MKNTSINSISRQLFLISILAILPVGCARETEEQQQPVPEKTEISTPNSNITEEDQDNQLIIENTEKPIDPIEEVAIEQPATLIEIENVIYFNFDRADLTKEAKVKLKQVSQKLVDSDRQITIAGHADEIGTHDYNLDLGRKRAEAVRDFLATLGVNRTNLSIVSYGETQPIVKSSKPEARSQNRRVEFTIVEPKEPTRSP